ncbi:class I SAM-dependent methyltransferase [bacterium]|nr:class I SAM-dependent methyltransferase [bacterium]
MSSWNFLSGFYYAWRRLPGIRLILDAEIRNCRDLWSRMPVSPDQILDVGTGAGSSLEIFPCEVEIIAVDTSRKMLRRARDRRKGLYAVQADVRALPFRDASFQAASAIGLTEYLPDSSGFLREIGRVTGPGGYLLSTFSRPNLLNRLRVLLGNRLYFKKADQWKEDAVSAGLEIKAEAVSLLQMQQLMRKFRS